MDCKNLDNISQLINISGRQRMLSQRIAFLILGKRSGFNGPFEDTMKLFIESHDLLVNGNDEMPCAKDNPEILEYFFGDKKADEKIKEYISHAKELFRLDNKDVSEFCTYAATKIVPLLNEAVLIYQKIANELNAEVDAELKQKNKSIQKTFKEIALISKQSKMISFNTAIIASKAGKIGNEFMVVGNEMQKLTTEIDELIDKGLKDLAS